MPTRPAALVVSIDFATCASVARWKDAEEAVWSSSWMPVSAAVRLGTLNGTFSPCATTAVKEDDREVKRSVCVKRERGEREEGVVCWGKRVE